MEQSQNASIVVAGLEKRFPHLDFTMGKESDRFYILTANRGGASIAFRFKLLFSDSEQSHIKNIGNEIVSWQARNYGLS